MDGQDLVDVLRSDHDATLERLGSSKSLYALTRGRVDVEHVRAAAIGELAAAHGTLESWGEDESHRRAAALFSTAAATIGEHYDRAAVPDVDHEPRKPLYDTIVAIEGTAPRLGGLLGWTLVAIPTVEQVVGFFVGRVETDVADGYREVLDAVEHLRDRTATTIGRECEADRDWTAAEDAAHDVVEAADAAYRDTLDDLDVDPE